MSREGLALWGPSRTDPDLIAAVQRDFGPITVDLAATMHDKVVHHFIGPEMNSLTADWTAILSGGIGWLNPDGDMSAWAAKCAEEALRGAKILFIAPGHLDNLWFQRYVWPHAAVFTIFPQLAYEGRMQLVVLCAFNITDGLDLPWKAQQLFHWNWHTGEIR